MNLLKWLFGKKKNKKENKGEFYTQTSVRRTRCESIIDSDYRRTPIDNDLITTNPINTMLFDSTSDYVSDNHSSGFDGGFGGGDFSGSGSGGSWSDSSSSYDSGSSYDSSSSSFD